MRYEGEYKQIEFRPGVATGDQTFNWRRNVTIKSLVTPEEHKTAMYRGKPVACRWIEIKVETGKAGRAGTRHRTGRRETLQGADPRVAGLWHAGGTTRASTPTGFPWHSCRSSVAIRKLGNRKEEQIKTKVLQIYPAISLLKHYKVLHPETGEPEDPALEALGAVNAIKWVGAEARCRAG